MNKTEKAIFGGGCFWCLESAFSKFKGVENVVSGYSGGHIKNPAYKEVCTGRTGHAEVVKIEYNASIISFIELLEIFFKIHNPTTLNKQGNDVGTQYRSVIYYVNEEQKTQSLDFIKDLEANAVYQDKIVTEITVFDVFYPAEDYHQNYYNNNKEEQYCQFVVAPKLKKVTAAFKEKLKDNAI